MMQTGMPKKPGNIETRLSMAVLAVLVIVGIGVFLRQFQINPAVIARRPESQQTEMPSANDQAALINTAGSGIVPFSPLERFGPDRLYEKINGRADLYLTSGFVSLATQRFTVDNPAGNWIELFVYDMNTPENAFSVFSMQRRESAVPEDIVPDSYRTENALFMAHGEFYLELIGTDASDNLNRALGVLARRFVETHAATPMARAPGTDLFPEAGLQTGTLKRITANAFGYEELDNIYTAEFLIDGTGLTAFISDRHSDEAASGLVERYRQTLLSYGATRVDMSLPVEKAEVLQFFDTYEIIFGRGKHLAGVHEATDLEAAGILAKRLAGHLEQVGNREGNRK